MRAFRNFFFKAGNGHLPGERHVEEGIFRRSQKGGFMRKMMCVGVSLLALAACESLSWSEKGQGILSLQIQNDARVFVKSTVPTADYEVVITTAGGEQILSERYASLPEQIMLDPGKYKVRAVSEAIGDPAFDKPIYGATLDVTVEAGVNNTVQMTCAQINAGLRIVYEPEFVSNYANYTVDVSGDDGNLQYVKTETRTGYFAPGTLNIYLEIDGEDSYSLSKNVSPRDMLVLTVASIPGTPGNEQGISLSIDVDTTRTWRREQWRPGGPADGSTPASAYSVTEAIQLAAGEDVWICGYIVGGDVSTSAIKTSPPFTAASNLALADSPLETERGNCMAVEISAAPKAIKDAFNMTVNGSELLGQRVWFKGNIAAYFGKPGIRAPKEAQL